jgi:hypothetical protein
VRFADRYRMVANLEGTVAHRYRNVVDRNRQVARP